MNATLSPWSSIPNLLTLARIGLIPIFVLAFYLPFQWSPMFCAILFSLACVTDWLDGFLARILKQTSAFGAFLDPVADKLLVTFALVLLIGQYGALWVAIPAGIIICREILISALREWMAEIGQRNQVAVGWIGKLKTAVQMMAIILLLSQSPDLKNKIIWAGFVLMYVSAGLTVWSMVIYLKAAWKEINAQEEKN